LILPDINVWVSIVSTSHEAHRSSTQWLAGVPTHESVVFCRVTQLGMLRLLTTSSVMKNEVMTQREAWAVYENLLLDRRMNLTADSPGLSGHLKR
jgi:predicted nucleic acid-binding protein